MSIKTAKSTKATKEEKTAETEGAHSCACIPSGESPSCCGPGTNQIMPRFVGQFQAE